MADESRYQTVYARERGAVAAPTDRSPLSTKSALGELRARGITMPTWTLHGAQALFSRCASRT